MRNKNEKKGTWLDSDLKISFASVLGFVLGATVIGSTYERDEDGAYRRGRADGIQECQKAVQVREGGEVDVALG